MGNSTATARNQAIDELLAQLRGFRGALGGRKWFTTDPQLTGDKLTVRQLRECTDYEYIYLMVLGFQAIQRNAKKILRLNNGKVFAENPGTRFMETTCGITMHAEREGAAMCVKDACDILIRAYQTACENSSNGSVLKFFRGAFERTADPCLEGRISRLLAYLETAVATELNAGDRPWEDFGVKPLADANNMQIIGEYLRVFTNECIYTWSKRNRMPYVRAKDKTALMELKDIQCFAPAFTAYLKKERVIPDMMTDQAAREVIEQYIALDTLDRGYVAREKKPVQALKTGVRPARATPYQSQGRWGRARA